MQRGLTHFGNGLVASDSSTLKLSTSFSGPRRCMIFDIEYKLILNHLRKVNDLVKILQHPNLHAQINQIKILFLIPFLGIKKKDSTLS